MKQRIALISAIAALCIVQPAMAQFGGSVAAAGGDLLVAEGGGHGPGALHVYRRASNGTWTERAKVSASNGQAGDNFGARMAVDGDMVAVTAPRGGSGNGAIYVLRRDARANWTETGQMTAEAVRQDFFGNSVGLSGSVIAVGAPGRDSSRGAVFVFRRDGDRWTQSAMLQAPEPMVNERFGASLALSGDRLVIGASGRERNTGAAYVYHSDASGQWQLDTRLTVAGLPENSRLGGPVAIKDSVVALVAGGVDGNAGSVYLFKKDSTGTWVNSMIMRPFDQQRGMRFGTTLAFAGNDLYVGAPGATRNTGAIYRFISDGAGGWRSSDVVHATGVEAFDQFATSIAATGTTIVAGIPGDDYGAGTALVFEQDRTGGLRQGTRLTTEAAHMDAVTGSERRCDGHAAQFSCNNVDLQAFLPIQAIGGTRGVRLNDIWGWTDPTTNKEYALVGRINGTSFVDITDASHPVYLGDLPMTPGARANAWRDIKTYHDHAFIVADGAGQHGMQVFDLTLLRDVRPGSPRTFQPLTTYTRIASAHNIVINEQSGYAYAVGASSGGETCGGGLHMIDIRTPAQPTFAGCFSDPSTGLAHTGYSHDAQCVTYHGPDARYQGHELCLGSNETALSIADVTDKSHPVPISSATYPNVSYAHQGWLTEDHRYFYMDDEGDEMSGKVSGTRTLIWDLSDLHDPVLAGEHISTNHAIDHNLYVRGNYMYQSNYTSGLRVLDITDRTNPREVGFMDTDPFGADDPVFEGSWSNYPYFRSGTVIVSSISEGLFVVRPRVMTPVP